MTTSASSPLAKLSEVCDEFMQLERVAFREGSVKKNSVSGSEESEKARARERERQLLKATRKPGGKFWNALIELEEP